MLAIKSRPKTDHIFQEADLHSFSLWPNALVPYQIASHYDYKERSIILEAMNEFHKVLNLKLKLRAICTFRYHALDFDLVKKVIDIISR